MPKEQILWCVKNGDPDHMEQVLSTDPSKFDDAKQWAKNNGYGRFRIAIIDMDKAPNFTKTIKSNGK